MILFGNQLFSICIKPQQNIQFIMIATSKRPFTALRDGSTGRLSTELIKNYIHTENTASQAFQQPKLLRLSRKTIAKRSHKSSTNVTIHQQKQHLYIQSLNLKQKFHEVCLQNTKFKTRILALEKELAKKNKIIMNRNSELIVNRETNMNLKQIEVNSTLVTNLKALLIQERNKYEKLFQECQRLRKSVKYTKIVELQLQLKAFQQQAIRLSGILADIDQCKLVENKSFKKFTKLQKKFKQKQEENLALLQINLKYENRLAENEKQTKNKDQINKNTEMKLLGQLDEVKKRLAISMKSRKILKTNIKGRLVSEQNREGTTHHKQSNKNATLNNRSDQKESESYRPNNHLKRPLTASNKANRMQFHHQTLQPVVNITQNKSSQYQNIYDQEDDFEDYRAQQNNDKDQYCKLYPNTKQNDPRKINTIIEQQESFNQFDQLSYLITYRFLAQGWNYSKFADQIKKKYTKEIKVSQIQKIVISQPFYLEEGQAEFLIQYLFDVESINQIKSTSINDFLQMMKNVIYEYHSFSPQNIKQTRSKLVKEYTQNRQKWQKLFDHKNQYIHHNQFHQILSKYGFKEEQAQQIIAEISLFIYDLTQFSFDALVKYIDTLQQKNGKIKETPPNV